MSAGPALSYATRSVFKYKYYYYGTTTTTTTNGTLSYVQSYKTISVTHMNINKLLKRLTTKSLLDLFFWTLFCEGRSVIAGGACLLVL